jgi:hypothetical protein
VQVLNAPGTEAPRIYALAKHDSEPMLMRQVNSQREDIVVLSGLSAGSYAVSVSAQLDDGNQVAGNLERTIEFDGTHDVDLDFEPRPPK